MTEKATSSKLIARPRLQRRSANAPENLQRTDRANRAPSLGRRVSPQALGEARNKPAAGPRISRLATQTASDGTSELLDSSPAAYLLLAEDTKIQYANHAACTLLGIERAAPLTREFLHFVAPAFRAALVRHQRAAKRAKVVTELSLRRDDGSSFQARMVSVPVVPSKQGLQGLHVWITDASDHLQTNHALRASEQRCRTLFEQAPLCMFFVELAPTSAIVRDANRRAQLVYGYAADELRGMPVARLAAEDTRAAVLSMISQVQQGITVTHETVHRRRDGTLFQVRINATADPSDPHCMLMIVEDTTAEQLRRSETQAIDAERRRMSHEIHDSVAQRLAALCMRSALWRRLSETATPGMDGALEELQHELNAAIEDIRRAIFAVRPVDLKEMDFFPAVTRWVNGFSLQNKLTIQLSFLGPREKLPSNYELPLFRIIQEAFSNILRHAGASTARISLTVGESGAVVLTVRDDGKGFDPKRVGPAAQAPHFGLPQMRERLLELGGTLAIKSAKGNGTELLVNLPPITRQTQEAIYQGPQRRVVARRQKDRS